MEISFRAECCIENLDRAKMIDGDILELGVGGATTTFVLAEFLKNEHIMGKKIYACDCFSGLPYTDEGTCVTSDLKKNEVCGISLEDFKSTILSRGYKDTIVPVEGIFEESLIALEDKRFCFVWLDADLYTSTLVGYEFIKDRVNIGGIIGFHDYGFRRTPGVKVVVDEVLDKSKYEKIFHEKSSIFFKRIK